MIDKHTATHVIDDEATALICICTGMCEAAIVLDAMPELEAVKDAIITLHAKACEAHKECMN